MRQSEILKVLGLELGTSNIDEVNKALKAKDFKTKFRMTGPAFVHFGFTGLIKSLTPDGVKVYNVNKVNLIRYEDIQTFAKSLPREERKDSPKSVNVDKTANTKPENETKTEKSVKKIEFTDEEDYDNDDDYENDDDFDEEADEDDDIIENESVKTQIVTSEKKKPKKSALNVPGSGSLFIPKKR